MVTLFIEEKEEILYFCYCEVVLWLAMTCWLNYNNKVTMVMQAQ